MKLFPNKYYIQIYSYQCNKLPEIKELEKFDKLKCVISYPFFNNEYDLEIDIKDDKSIENILVQICNKYREIYENAEINKEQWFHPLEVLYIEDIDLDTETGEIRLHVCS